MPIRKLFHVMCIVDDFDEAQSRWDAVLTPDTYRPKSWSDFDKRWASLGHVGDDFVLEIMEPSKLEEDKDFPLPKFLNRFGEHWHSFSWFVDHDDFKALFTRLRAHGVRVAGPRGLLEGDVEDMPRTIFTHGRDTGGQIEFQDLGSEDGRAEATTPAYRRKPADFWRNEHGMGLIRTSHLTAGVADLARMKALWTGPIQGQLFHESTAADRQSAFIKVGDETIVELAQPTTEDSRLGKDLARHGELPHAVTFQVADLAAAERYLEKVGVRVAERQGDGLTVNPDDLFGLVLSFTEGTIPNDPRG